MPAIKPQARHTVRTASDSRQASLAAIHIGQKALGLTKEDAQALKLAITGQASAADMTAPQLRHYLAHLSSLQAIAAGTPKPAYTGPRRNLERSLDDGSDARWRKARALWSELAQAGLVHTNTNTALMAYVQRQTHVSAWRFLNSYQINCVIEALKHWCSRAQAETQA